ncbi:hypothetical protein CVT25_005370 [Psilocybe cyanescens]|uniref:Uncharacterized protein n=1 Tax=Psilocybe cyanescens TaxID=93625 RepID=A0A409XS37_PSICY|nr:hypothetical protein CVT25_005370 [Psilocybe cyanescens]
MLFLVASASLSINSELLPTANRLHLTTNKKQLEDVNTLLTIKLALRYVSSYNVESVQAIVRTPEAGFTVEDDP